MPPKKAPQQPSKKADAKKKDKIIEDKTFGLKNKKGAKQQRFIQQVEKQVKFGNNPKKAAEAGAKKEDKKKELADLLIFRPVASQKIEKGVDPKSVLCAFFKQGQCTKGDKCKFSHDLNIERKAEKKSLYFDAREGEGNPEDNMENWDEEKLKEVVAKKHGEREKKLPPTDIICKHFLAAIELNKYGWFWECPAGGDKCHYRHALPPGFVLKRDKKKDKKDEDITIEELVEIERSKLGYNLTKITLETFIAWKKKKVAEKQATAKKESDRKKAEFKAGKNLGLSGREMFTFNPEMAKDGDMEEGEAAMDIVREDQDEDGAAVKEIDLEAIACEAIDTDGTGTQAEATPRNFSTTKRPTEGGEENSTTSAAASETKAAENGDEGGGDEDIINEPIDESLFAEDDLDDLEDDLAGVSLKG